MTRQNDEQNGDAGGGTGDPGDCAPSRLPPAWARTLRLRFGFHQLCGERSVEMIECLPDVIEFSENGTVPRIFLQPSHEICSLARAHPAVAQAQPSSCRRLHNDGWMGLIWMRSAV